MQVSVFGLGYVGFVSAACLAAEGHSVIGVDINSAKVHSLNSGRCPIVEPGLDELIAKAVTAGKLRATSNAHEAIRDSELSFVCVGTPSGPNGELDLDSIRRVSSDIGQGLRNRQGYHLVVVRSTMLPGSTETCVLPILERQSGCQGRPSG